MRHCHCFVFAVAVSVCAAAVGNAQTSLRFQFKEGEKLTYAIQEKTTTMTKLKDKSEVVKMTRDTDLNFNVLKPDRDGSATVQFKATRVHVIIDGKNGKVEVDSKNSNETGDEKKKSIGQVAKANASMDVTATMLPSGELKDAKASEETIKAYKSLPGADRGEGFNPNSLKDTIANLVLPKEAIAKGKTWSNKVESKSPTGKIIADNTYTYEGPVQKDGATLEKLALNATIKSEPEPSSPVKFEVKNGKATGEIYFNNKTGQLVESTITLHAEQGVQASGVTFSQTIDRTVTIRLKKQ